MPLLRDSTVAPICPLCVCCRYFVRDFSNESVSVRDVAGPPWLANDAGTPYYWNEKTDERVWDKEEIPGYKG